MALSGLALPVMAQSTLEEISRAVVLVACDKLQGSGTVINGVDGYVLTDGHVTRLQDSSTQASMVTSRSISIV